MNLDCNCPNCLPEKQRKMGESLADAATKEAGSMEDDGTHPALAALLAAIVIYRLRHGLDFPAVGAAAAHLNQNMTEHMARREAQRPVEAETVH